MRPAKQTIGPVTREIAERVTSIRLSDLKPDIVTLAKQCVLDVIGCAIAGSTEPLYDILVADALQQGSRPVATIIGSNHRVSPDLAGTINGASAHAHDYDDVHMVMFGHPTAAVLPAVLALAESRQASGAALIEAFVSGYEAACQIGALVTHDHYVRGFHTTGTLGTFGAAAGCARLLELTEQQTAVALGIAGTQAAGLKCMFGTMCKPLHAGLAARNGLYAARLAQRGFTARGDVLEAGQGFIDALGVGVANAMPVPISTDRYWIEGNLFKYHAACFDTHAPMEATRRLLASGLTSDQVAKLTVRLPPSLDKTCNIPDPKTGAESKFSVRYAIACTLAGLDTSSLETFSDASVGNPAVRKFFDRIAVELVPDMQPLSRAEIHVSTTSGAKHVIEHDCDSPDHDLVRQGQRLERKFLQLAGLVFDSTQCAAIIKLVDELERLPNVEDLTGNLQTRRENGS